MVIKFRGYLGGHCLNIGTTMETRIIGAIGRKWTRHGIKATSRAFKEEITVMFLCPIRSGGTNSERHQPGRKSRRAFREGRTCDFE
jgi:hypothetical protein